MNARSGRTPGLPLAAIVGQNLDRVIGAIDVFRRTGRAIGGYSSEIPGWG